MGLGRLLPASERGQVREGRQALTRPDDRPGLVRDGTVPQEVEVGQRGGDEERRVAPLRRRRRRDVLVFRQASLRRRGPAQDGAVQPREEGEEGPSEVCYLADGAALQVGGYV